MLAKDIEFKTLTRELLEKRLGEFRTLEENWTEIGEPAWSDEQFRRDLDGKWDLSVVSEESSGKINGYAIGSAEPSGKIVRLNKLLVGREARGAGIAKGIWDAFLQRARNANAREIFFRALVNNDAANKFYRKNGCIFVGQKEGEDGRTRNEIKYIIASNPGIPHSKPSLFESSGYGLIEVLRKNEIVSGRVVNDFVRKVSEYVQQSGGIATSSGSAALFLALRALGIKEGDEVILPSYVCYSVLGAVNQTHATPVVADINEYGDYNISAGDAKRKLTDKTRAIIIPQMFGNPVKNLEEFFSFGVPIIEDIAQSIGAQHSGRRVGSFGDIAICSFYATKMMTTGVGGMVLAKQMEIVKRLEDLTQYDGRDSLGECYNLKMSDLQAALGISQLARLSDFVELRKRAAGIYREILGGKAETRDSPENIFFRYIIETDDASELIANLNGRGINARRPVYKPLSQYVRAKTPNSERAYERAVSLPIFPKITDDEIHCVAGAVANSDVETGK
jgi:dTDP-4-amino-4,6-dideoxygalactose transaminase/ribosomal protein S18 acetylase RimI-like enzyme